MEIFWILQQIMIELDVLWYRSMQRYSFFAWVRGCFSVKKGCLYIITINISFVVGVSAQVSMGGVTQTMVFWVLTHCSMKCVLTFWRNVLYPALWWLNWVQVGVNMIGRKKCVNHIEWFGAVEERGARNCTWSMEVVETACLPLGSTTLDSCILSLKTSSAVCSSTQLILLLRWPMLRLWSNIRCNNQYRLLCKCVSLVSL